MSKQITQLAVATSFNNGDLALIADTGGNVERSITKEKLQESFGNTAINGYQASSSVDNEIQLVATNGAIITAYIEGMTINFISPIESTGVVTVKIDTLGQIPLQLYSEDTTVALINNENVSAVYTGGKFKQTNKLNTNLVYTNAYNATGVITGADPNFITTYTLTSAKGVTKASYYKGMSLWFTAEEASKGTIRVKVDDLEEKDLIDPPEFDAVNFQSGIYKGDLIVAIYDDVAGKFVKREFPNIAKPLPEFVEGNLILPNIPDDIWDPNYEGDPDDPANAEFPNSLNSQGKPFFNYTIRVGPGQAYTSLNAALITTVNSHGPSGNGFRVAIEMMGDYVPTTRQAVHPWTNAYDVSDLRWISIFSEGENYIDFSNSMILCSIASSPIFNCRLIRVKNAVDAVNTALFWTGLEDVNITFGRNSRISYQHTVTADKVGPIFIGEVSIIALYGFIIDSTNTINKGATFLNKAQLTYTSVEANPVNFIEYTTNTSFIYNSRLYCDTGLPTSLLFVNLDAGLFLQNTHSSTRKNLTKGIEGANINMKNCNFEADDTVIDIAISGGNKLSRIILDNTQGVLNQALDVESANGKIVAGNL